MLISWISATHIRKEYQKNRYGKNLQGLIKAAPVKFKIDSLLTQINLQHEKYKTENISTNHAVSNKKKN